MADKVKAIDLNEIPRAEAIRIVMMLFDWDRARAEQFVAISRGEIEGDIVFDPAESGISNISSSNPPGPQV